MGEAAILISGGRHRTLVRSDNLVANTSLHHFARWHRAGRPGLRWAGVGNSFIGNRIYEAPHQGVEGGGSSAKCGACIRGRKGDLECEYTGNGTAPGMDDATCGANGKIVITFSNCVLSVSLTRKVSLFQTTSGAATSCRT